MVCSDIASPHWLLSCFPSDRKKKASNCCLFPWLLWVTDLQYPLQTGSLYCLAFPPTKGRRLSKTLKLPPACVWVQDMGKKYIAPPDGHSDMRLGSRHEYIALSRRIHCVIVWLSLLLLVTNAQSCCLWGNFFEAALIDCVNNEFAQTYICCWAKSSCSKMRSTDSRSTTNGKKPSRLRFVLLFLSATQPSCWQRQWRQLRKTLEKHLTQNNNLLSPQLRALKIVMFFFRSISASLGSIFSQF